MKRQLYSREYQAGQDDNHRNMNEHETPDQKSIRLTGTALSQSTTPKSDSLVEGDGSIFINWYGNSNLLVDRDAFITYFVTATPPIYST